MSRALLLLHSLRYLRWQQLAYRPWRRLQRALPPPRDAAAWRPSSHLARFTEYLRAAEPPDLERSLRLAARAGEGRFEFLGTELRLDPVDWRARQHSHLWSYHLHYFDYALDLAHAFRSTGDAVHVRTFERLALGWIEQTANGEGDGWEPYPLATRVPNWLLALSLFGDALDAACRSRIMNSAYRQLLQLERTLEYHLLANHLQRNLYALAVGGLCFDSEPATRWRGGRTDELWRELFEQVLPDGGHYERSPMYHALALGDFLTILELRLAAGEPVPAAVRERVRVLAGALPRLARPDGSLHLFNDSANGTAPAPGWLRARAARVLAAPPGSGNGAWELPHTGYFGWADESAGERFIVDCGEIGPSYNAAHGHCDMLSFELDLFGRPVCVDAGVSGYGGDPWRAYVRSTAAHNTVVIGGREQSELWGTFRVARRAQPEFVGQQASAGAYRFEGACRPYFDRRVRHARVVTREEHGWTITDCVTGARGRTLHSYLHFHPACSVTATPGGFTVRAGSGALRVDVFGADDVALDTTSHRHCPSFGAALPAPTLVLVVHANDERTFGYRLAPQADHGH